MTSEVIRGYNSLQLPRLHRAHSQDCTIPHEQQQVHSAGLL